MFVISASSRLIMFTRVPVRLVLVILTMNQEFLSGEAPLISE